MSCLDSFKAFIENPRSVSGNKYVQTECFSYGRRTAIEILCWRTFGFVWWGFCCSRGEHFAVLSKRVLIFNKGPLGNFIEICSFLPGDSQQGAVCWLCLSWVSLVMQNTKKSGKNHGISFRSVWDVTHLGPWQGTGQIYVRSRSRLESTISVAWGHDYSVPHVLIKRNQTIIRTVHVMVSLVQRVNESAGGTMALGWKGEDLSGSS